MNKPLVAIDAQIATMEADQRLGLAELPRITTQQRVYVAARVGGLSMTAAAKEAGCATTTARQWEDDEDVQAHVIHYENQTSELLTKVKFGIEDAHAMYMKAYHVSATAAEMVRATDSLVKLHRIGDQAPAAVPKNVTARQLADLPLAELMRLAGLKVESLLPEPIDGEFSQA